jgi:hypothetical protein
MANPPPTRHGRPLRHRPVRSLLGWWLTSLVRSMTTEVVRAVASAHDSRLPHRPALQGLLRSIVDAEELQQQAEREFQNPGRWGLTFPTSSAGHAWSLDCSGTQT